MKLHRNAKSTPSVSIALVRRVLFEGWSYAAAADGFAVSVRTVAKWVRRFREGGVADSRTARRVPGAPPHQTPPGAVTLIRILREQHGLPAWAIGQALRLPRSTVSAWLRRLGLNRPPVAPPVPIQRYEWPRPGDLLHVDIKPLGRIDGIGHRIHGDRRRGRAASAGSTCTWPWMITAASRMCEVLADQLGPTCAAFLHARSPGFGPAASRYARVMSDNGSGYVSRVFRATCADLGLRHLRTRAYTPADERQGRAIHPDALAGVGIRRCRMPPRTNVDRSSDPMCAITTATDHTRASTIRLPGHGSRALRDEQRV